MLLQKQRNSTFGIRVMVIGTLVFGTGFAPTDAYGMGQGKKINGSLDRTTWGGTGNACVRDGIGLTGLGVVAISYRSGHLRCDMFDDVDTVVTNQSWCSQWVVPGAVDHCLTSSSKPKAKAEWIGCVGSTPRFSVTWWEVDDYVEVYTVQRFNGSSWASYFQGDETCLLHLGNSSFRVKAANSAGSSGWVYFSGSATCGGGGGVPN